MTGEQNFLAGGGEMGAAMRRRNWSSSPLGAPSGWPQPLKTVVELMINSKQPMFVAWGPQLAFLYNDGYAPLFGKRHPHMMGQPFHACWPEIWDDIKPLIDRALAGEPTWSEDLHLVVERSGHAEDAWFSFSYSPVRDASSRVAGMFCSVTETTQQVLAGRRAAFRIELADELQRLADDEPGIKSRVPELLARHLGASCAGYAEIDASGRYADVAQEWTRPGFPGVRGRHLLENYGVDHIARLQGGRVTRIADTRSDPLTHASEGYAGLQVRSIVNAPILRQGQLASILYVLDAQPRDWSDADEALVQEVAERTGAAIERARASAAERQALAALADSEARFRSVADSAPVMIWVTGPDGACTYLSRSWYEFTGQTPADGLGFGWLDATHPDDAARAEQTFREANARQEGFRLEYRLRRADGSYAYALDAAVPRVGSAGEFLGYVGSVLDIDERRRSEQRLLQSEGRFRAAIDAVQGILWTNDADGRMVDEQPGWAALTGQAPAEYHGYGWTDVVHPDDAQPTLAAWNEAVAERKTFVFEHRVRRHDGQWRRYAVRAVPTLAPDGSVLEWVGVHTDVTEQRDAEHALQGLTAQLEQRVREATAAERGRLEELVEARAQLHELQKMETLGQLTGGIAHDFNNLLAPIVGCLDIVRRKLPGDERMLRVVAGAQRSADRARTLISRLLLFARREHLQPRAVDTIDLMAGLEELVMRSVGPQIDLRLEVDSGTPAVYIDPNQLELAVLNLVVNARDAMPGGGSLRITVRGASAQEAGHASRLAPGAYVRLEVADTGSGMDAETLRRAVEPFFTTKGVGKGTGLGLSMAHGLAFQSGGAMQLASTPGRGTTVTLWLPVAQEGAAAGPRQEEGPLTPCRALSIALVDDEELVRAGTAELLDDLGHRVRPFASAREALDALREGLAVDLLVTDYMMPGMTGTELVRQARQLRPALPAFLITGYATLSDDEALGLPRLAKPFRSTDLSSMVAAVAMPPG